MDADNIPNVDNSSMTCCECGEIFDLERVAMIDGYCPDCFMEWEAEQEKVCYTCSGTGISAFGRVDDSCNMCNGRGY